MIIEKNSVSVYSLRTGVHLILAGVGALVYLFGTFIFCVAWPDSNLQLYQGQINYFQQLCQTNF